ncbi:MAG: hypothetical protein M3Q00_05865 [Pseudomonadota bacterium]|nr:hypothetical protein [Pseudomonadota bacterium]
MLVKHPTYGRRRYAFLPYGLCADSNVMALDFRNHLRRQLGFLKRSSESFDRDNRDEAVRIATTIRILIHNTQSSVSLLKHMNATTISLLSSCEGASAGAVLYIGLGSHNVKSESGVTS